MQEADLTGSGDISYEAMFKATALIVTPSFFEPVCGPLLPISIMTFFSGTALQKSVFW